MKIGLLVPHIFMQDDLLPDVIFAPAQLAINLADNLKALGHDVTLFSPGPVLTKAKNINADLSLFETELAIRGDSYLSLLKKHSFTFVTLARQVQIELIAKAIKMANDGKFDVLHFYTNEEELALPLAVLCQKPAVFTHHDPFNFLVRYKSIFPKYKKLNWVSLSYAQRRGMPAGTNWLANIYNGLEEELLKPNYLPNGGYVAYLGRIISSKGVHLAIMAVQHYNQTYENKIKLKIAGKHYAGHTKDNYWTTKVLPFLSDPNIEYVGYIKDSEEKQEFLGNARALFVPSTFEEPFGMVMIEALACGTPIIGLNSGAIPEILKLTKSGIVVDKLLNESDTVSGLSEAIEKISDIDRRTCRREFEKHFTARKMAIAHQDCYKKLIKE